MEPLQPLPGKLSLLVKMRGDVPESQREGFLVYVFVTRVCRNQFWYNEGCGLESHVHDGSGGFIKQGLVRIDSGHAHGSVSYIKPWKWNKKSIQCGIARTRYFKNPYLCFEANKTTTLNYHLYSCTISYSYLFGFSDIKYTGTELLKR